MRYGLGRLPIHLFYFCFCIFFLCFTRYLSFSSHLLFSLSDPLFPPQILLPLFSYSECFCLLFCLRLNCKLIHLRWRAGVHCLCWRCFACAAGCLCWRCFACAAGCLCWR